MKYIYVKEATNHNNLPIKIGNSYTIKKDLRFSNSYIITNFGLIISEYTLKSCFKEDK